MAGNLTQADLFSCLSRPLDHLVEQSIESKLEEDGNFSAVREIAVGKEHAQVFDYDEGSEELEVLTASKARDGLCKTCNNLIGIQSPELRSTQRPLLLAVNSAR